MRGDGLGTFSKMHIQLAIHTVYPGYLGCSGVGGDSGRFQAGS